MIVVPGRIPQSKSSRIGYYLQRWRNDQNAKDEWNRNALESRCHKGSQPAQAQRQMETGSG
jgi:hypothetical protein